MKIVFSRKGFDTGSGGAPSPILDGVPISLPIPSGPSEPLRYRDIDHPLAGNLGPIVAETSRGRIHGARRAHVEHVKALPFRNIAGRLRPDILTMIETEEKKATEAS